MCHIASNPRDFFTLYLAVTRNCQAVSGGAPPLHGDRGLLDEHRLTHTRLDVTYLYLVRTHPLQQSTADLV